MISLADGSERGPVLGGFSRLAWIKMTHGASMGLQQSQLSFPTLFS